MPTFTITCPGCNKSLRVPVSKRGRWICCPGCNFEFAAMSDDGDDPPDVDTGPPPRPARRICSVGLTIAGCLLFLVFLTGVLVYAKNRPAAGDRLPNVARGQRQADVDRPPPVDRAEQERAGAILTSLLTGLAMVVVAIVLYVVFTILLVAWVAKDSRRRGIDGAPVWAGLVLVTGVVGLLIYVASRPAGQMVVCQRCHGLKLEYLRSCPHCRHEPRRSRRTLLLA